MRDRITAKEITKLILVSTGSLGSLFLVIYGGLSNSPSLYTPGVAIIGSIITHFIDSKHISTLERNIEEWKKWSKF